MGLGLGLGLGRALGLRGLGPLVKGLRRRGEHDPVRCLGAALQRFLQRHLRVECGLRPKTKKSGKELPIGNPDREAWGYENLSNLESSLSPT